MRCLLPSGRPWIQAFGPFLVVDEYLMCGFSIVYLFESWIWKEWNRNWRGNLFWLSSNKVPFNIRDGIRMMILSRIFSFYTESQSSRCTTFWESLFFSMGLIEGVWKANVKQWDMVPSKMRNALMVPSNVDARIIWISTGNDASIGFRLQPRVRP